MSKDGLCNGYENTKGMGVCKFAKKNNIGILWFACEWKSRLKEYEMIKLFVWFVHFVSLYVIKCEKSWKEMTISCTAIWNPMKAYTPDMGMRVL